MEKRFPPEREREGEAAKESRGVSQVPRSVAGRARVGRPVNVLNFQNRREKPRAAEFPRTPRRTKGIPARQRHGQAPWLVPSHPALGPPRCAALGRCGTGDHSGSALIIAREKKSGGASRGAARARSCGWHVHTSGQPAAKPGVIRHVAKVPSGICPLQGPNQLENPRSQCAGGSSCCGMPRC